jgi:hypothetical protein
VHLPQVQPLQGVLLEHPQDVAEELADG